jgi:hypothetical protein
MPGAVRLTSFLAKYSCCRERGRATPARSLNWGTRPGSQTSREQAGKGGGAAHGAQGEGRPQTIQDELGEDSDETSWGAGRGEPTWLKETSSVTNDVKGRRSGSCSASAGEGFRRGRRAGRTPRQQAQETRRHQGRPSRGLDDHTQICQQEQQAKQRRSTRGGAHLGDLVVVQHQLCQAVQGAVLGQARHRLAGQQVLAQRQLAQVCTRNTGALRTAGPSRGARGAGRRQPQSHICSGVQGKWCWPQCDA